MDQDLVWVTWSNDLLDWLADQEHIYLKWFAEQQFHDQNCRRLEIGNGLNK